MNVEITKTLKKLELSLSNSDLTHNDLCKSYEISIRLRSQFLGLIYEKEMFNSTGGLRIADTLATGKADEEMVMLIINEPLPSLKEMTAATQEHWLELIHTAIRKAAEDKKLPYFKKAFVWIEISTPVGSNNKKLWDTSNRAINLIINNLKGIFFEDDNYEHMAFGVVGKWAEKEATVVQVMDFNRVYQRIFPDSP